MPNIWMYPQVKAFVPNATPPNDVVVMDVTKYHRPFFKYDNKGDKQVRFTPKEMGLPPFRSMDNVLTGGFEPEAIEAVAEARNKNEKEMEQRVKETEERRAARRIEQAKQHASQVAKGASLTDADYYVEMRRAFEDTNRIKKDAMQKLEDEIRLRNRIKMAKLRARRGQKK